MKRIIRLLIIWIMGAVSLFGFERWHIGIGAELYMPKPSGTISNIASGDTTFKTLGFTKSDYASIFHIDVRNDYMLIPNVKVSFFNFKDTENTELNTTVEIAHQDFNSTIQSQVDYRVISALFYKGFTVKGDYIHFFSWEFYSGDLEFLLGIDAKFVDWKYTIKDRSDLTRSPAWVRSQTVIPQVFLGIGYYLYNFVFEAQTSNIAFSTSKLIEYSADAKYRFGDSFYLKAGYLFSKIHFVHDDDEVDYKTKGVRVGFEYIF